MKLLSSSVLLLLSNNIDITHGEQPRIFVDDAGVMHTSTKDTPTILCSARTALALEHQFKLDPTRYVGTYGNYFPRGSLGEVDDPDYVPYWPTDPTHEEIKFLKSIPTFSPSCYDSKDEKCDDIDVDAVIASEPDHWVYIGNGYWNTGPDMKRIADAMGKPPIFISTHYEGNLNAGCITYDDSTGTYTTTLSKCKARSLLDVIKRTNELATFLGIPKIDLTKDQQEFCEHAVSLKNEAANAQTRGIRVMAVNPSISTDNSVTLYPISPITDPILRSYEELGVPMLHPGKHPSHLLGAEKISANEWFVDSPPGTTDFTQYNTNAYYPVDVWLLEGRRFFFNTHAEQTFIARHFPDSALLTNQISHWPMNDGPMSYTGASRIFRNMITVLQKANLQYDATQCVDADVTSDLFLNGFYGGLQGGEYACFNEEYLQKDYGDCKFADLQGGDLYVTNDNTPTVFKPQQEVQQEMNFTTIQTPKHTVTVIQTPKKSNSTIPEQNDDKSNDELMHDIAEALKEANKTSTNKTQEQSHYNEEAELLAKALEDANKNLTQHQKDVDKLQNDLFDQIKQDEAIKEANKNLTDQQVMEQQKLQEQQDMITKMIEQQTQQSMWTEDSEFRTEEKVIYDLAWAAITLVVLSFLAVFSAIGYFLVSKNKKSFLKDIEKDGSDSAFPPPTQAFLPALDKPSKTPSPGGEPPSKAFLPALAPPAKTFV